MNHRRTALLAALGALVSSAACASSPGPQSADEQSEPGTDAGGTTKLPADAGGGGDVVAVDGAGPADAIPLGDAGSASKGCTAGYTIDAQQPTTCIPYAASPKCLTCKELPGAGLGGPQTHLFAGSDATASALVVNAKGGLYRFHGDGSAAQSPFYYATASDPWYHLAPGSCYYSTKLDVRFHAPAGASFSRSGGGDTNFAVWDQAQGLLVEMYTSLASGGSRAFPVPSGCGSTAATACELPMSFAGGCGVQRAFGGVAGTDQDWGTADESWNGQTIGGSPGDFAAWAGTARLAELQLGRIAHALSAGYSCANPSVGQGGKVFPAHVPNYLDPNCSPATATGQLVFTDYTDAEITAMTVPPWQKVLLTALSHYGTYLLDTGGGATNTVSALSYNLGTEGFEAYLTAKPSCASACTTGSSACDHCTQPGFFGWLDTQSGVVGGEDILPWDAVPQVGGKGIEGHVHIADPCVAAGMAGANVGELGAPAACVGSLWVNLAGPGGDGTGAGVVTSTCASGTCAPVSCVGGFCNLSSDNGQVVTLKAVPDAGHAFGGWSGGCSGSGSACTVTLDGAHGVAQVIARFL